MAGGLWAAVLAAGWAAWAGPSAVEAPLRPPRRVPGVLAQDAPLEGSRSLVDPLASSVPGTINLETTIPTEPGRNVPDLALDAGLAMEAKPQAILQPTETAPAGARSDRVAPPSQTAPANPTAPEIREIAVVAGGAAGAAPRRSPDEAPVLTPERRKAVQAELHDPFPPREESGVPDTVVFDGPPPWVTPPTDSEGGNKGFSPPATMRRPAAEAMARLAPARAPAARVEQLARVLEIGNWEAPILADPDASLDLAIAAFRAGRIGAGQLATVALRASAFRDFSPKATERQAIPLLGSGGRLSARAAAMFAREGNNGLDPGQLKDFELRVQALPESERYIWALDLGSQLPDSGALPRWAQGYFAVQVSLTRHILRFPGLAHPLPVPSFGVMQAWLDARYGAQAIRLTPEFGETDMEAMVGLMQARTKPIGLHYPGMPTELDADGFPLTPFLYAMHDFFHAYIGSHYPVRYQRVLARALTAVWEDRRRRKSGGAPVVLPDGSALVLPPEELWARLPKLVDMSMKQSFSYYKAFGSRGGGPWNGWLIREDFGELPSPWTALLVRDMALHPEAWEGLGVEGIIQALGPGAREIYEAAARERESARGSRWDWLAGLWRRIRGG